MLALFTPVSLFMSHSIFDAQFAQSRSCSLNERFILVPFLIYLCAYSQICVMPCASMVYTWLSESE